VHDSLRCRETKGRRAQKREETEEYGAWLRVASPKRWYNQGGGWSSGQKQVDR
jgi:hypothetical protein